MKNIVLKEDFQTKGCVKNICELQKEQLIIINTFNKYSQEEISFYKKDKDNSKKFKFIFSTIEYEKILDLIELKNDKLLIVKDNEFKIIEVFVDQCMIKIIQTKKLEIKNEFFKEIIESINGCLISISYFKNEFYENRIIVWKKDLISGNYETYKDISLFEKPLSILEIDKNKFIVHFEDNTLYKFDSQTYNKNKVLKIKTKNNNFKNMIKVEENGILFIYENTLILFNLKNLINNIISIKYTINSICNIDNDKKYFLTSFSKNDNYGLLLFYINLNENKIYRINKVLINNAHSGLINSVYKLNNDNIVITGSSDKYIKIWETK